MLMIRMVLDISRVLFIGVEMNFWLCSKTVS